MQPVCLMSVLCIFVTFGECKTPGLQTRITEKALNYATNVALEKLSKQVTGQLIPDQHGSSGDVKFDITGMKVTDFNKPNSKVSMIQNVGLAWITSGTSLSVHGNFKYKYRKGIIKISDSGSFDLKTRGIDFHIKIEIGMDKHGRPTMRSVDCSCSVASADIRFHGGAAWIYNMFSGMLEGKLKDVVGGGNGILCKQLNTLVNVNGVKTLEKLPVTVDIAKEFTGLQILVRAFIPTHVYGDGEVYWEASIREAPFSAPPLLKSSDTSRMMYIWLSDYLFNSMSYNAYKYDKLQYNVTSKDLPSGVLNTTCPKSTCIGKLIPEIGKTFPNTDVKLLMKASVMPNTTVVNNATVVNASGDILFFARYPGAKNSTYFLTLSATMSTTVSFMIQNQKVHAKVLKLPVTVKVKDSKIGQLSPQALNFITNSVVSVFVEPKLNELGRAGFPLPVIDSVHFINTQLTVAKDTLLIATDLKYSG